MRTFPNTRFFLKSLSKIERLCVSTGLLSDYQLGKRCLSNHYLNIPPVPQIGAKPFFFHRSLSQTSFRPTTPLLPPPPTIPPSPLSYSTTPPPSPSPPPPPPNTTINTDEPPPPPPLEALKDLTEPPPSFSTPLLSVYTADHRAAGTSASPILTIIGDNSTLQFTLNGTFSRGSCCLFPLEGLVEKVGEVKSVEVSQVQMTIPSDRWLLEKMVVSVPGEEDIEFFCQDWIGSRSYAAMEGEDDGDEYVYEKVTLFPHCQDSVPAPYEWGEHDELQLSLGRSGVPSEDKIKRGFKSVVRKNNGFAGEDAYFISQGTRRERTKEKRAIDYSMPNVYYLGVADGVGMWRTHGVDSALYSQHLLHSAREAIGQFDNPDPYKVLLQAWEKTTIVHRVKGSCTVCIFRVNPDGWVDGVQIGDSGLLLVRDGKAIYRTSEQEHLFGFPYQLGHVSTTKPQDCIRHRFRVSPGDVIVMGSDGLFDNISDRSIAETVQDYCPIEEEEGGKEGGGKGAKSFNGDELSRKLVTTAYLNSIQKERDTPWSRAAQKEWDFPISGGKEDDVVVVVARIECHRGEES